MGIISENVWGGGGQGIYKQGGREEVVGVVGVEESVLRYSHIIENIVKTALITYKISVMMQAATLILTIVVVCTDFAPRIYIIIAKNFQVQSA